MNDSAPVLYFAFGANMARRVLVERRGIVPLTSEAAWLPGYALRFGLRGLPLIEPAFATIERAPEACVHGVLHALNLADLRRLDRMERAYDRIPVEVHTAGGAREATAYRARRSVPERPPSKRYLGILLEGAIEHGLPEAYCDALRALEPRAARGLSGPAERLVRVGEKVIGRLRR